MAYTTIDNPGLFFNTVLYTGDGNSSQSITGVGFQPDWVWLKNRSAIAGNHLSDAVRGKSGSNYYTLVTDTDAAQVVQGDNDGVNTLGTDGFSVGYTNSTAWNNNGNNYVSWNWLGANGTASNSNGSITSTVSANTTAGFSIVSYTGNGSAGATIGHGLSSQLDVIFIKNITDAEAWQTYHRPLGATHHLSLNTAASAQDNDSRFNDVDPTSSVFTLGNNDTVNKNSSNFIAYCFAEKKGYSKFGSYTGNGNSDGTFIYTGFRPAWIMTKGASRTTSWDIHDTKRDTFNVASKHLLAEDSGAEGNTAILDILSNGFKFRSSNGDRNASGETYIYMAFAESPFVTAGTKAAGTAR